MVLEISSTTDRIFCHLLQFFALLPPPHPLPPSQQQPEIEKKLGDIIILHLFTINDNHMMYSSRDMECDEILKK